MVSSECPRDSENPDPSRTLVVGQALNPTEGLDVVRPFRIWDGNNTE